MSDVATVEAFFEGQAEALVVHRTVCRRLEAIGPVEIRVSRSQVAFRRRIGFAWLWLPGRWLRNPAADVVLSIALGRREDSERFKEIVHPSHRIWMHHLEIHDAGDIDDEVAAWLTEAYERASWSTSVVAARHLR